MCYHIKGHKPIVWINQHKSIKCTLELFHANAFSYYIYQQPQVSHHSIIPHPAPLMLSNIGLLHENILYGKPVSVLHFWMEDIEPHVLSHAIDWVYTAYTAFFYGNHAQQIWNLPEEILFSHFMAFLNDTFEVELTQEDKGMRVGVTTSASQPHSTEVWESTMSPWWMISPSTWWTSVNHLHLWKNMQSCHLQDTDATTPHTAAWCSPALMMRAIWDAVNDAAHLPVQILEVQPQGSRCFIFSAPHHTHHNLFLTEAWDDVSSSFSEHFPTAPLDDDIWAEEQILDRGLCIHERPDEPNHQCSYLCSYESNITFWIDFLQSMPWNEVVFNCDLMDFSDILYLWDIMMTTRDADIPDPDDILDAAWFA